jgi:tryptophan-rich sensory protein
MNYFYLLFPIISVYITSIFFPVTQNAGVQVSFRPPPYVFAIVWPILLLLVGYSWTLRPELYILYFTLTILIACWSIAFYYSANIAFYEILLTEIVTIYIIVTKYDGLSSNLLIPLALWLAFASVLNYYSIV